MIPDTLVGVSLFLALLVPGFVYLQRLERFRAGVEYSTLRETGLVVVSSLVSMAIVGALFALLRSIPFRLLPDAWIPDLDAYVRGGEKYARSEYAEAAVWSVIIVGLASGIAALLAIPPDPRQCLPVQTARRLMARRRFGRPFRWLWGTGVVRRVSRRERQSRALDWVICEMRRRRGSGPITPESGWTAAIEVHPQLFKTVLCELDDGTAVHGHLYSASPQMEETGDRDLVLSSPLRRRTLDGSWKETPGATLVVSGSRMQFFSVSFSERPLPTTVEPVP